jgi:hypothetical protein
MLYWWYATNVYSLSGKGHRGKLPDCLEYAIKKHFPPEDNEEEYTQFKTTKKYNKKYYFSS